MTNNYALVTGASSGIGLQYARELASNGYNLIIVSNEEAIYVCASELKREFPDLNVVPLLRDLSLESAAKELYDYCQCQQLSVEVLVNNAGVYHDKDILDDSEDFTKLILNLHVNTPALLCYYFGNDMRASHKGYILNMCSITASMPVQRLGTYGSTKIFLENFTRSLHIELHNQGVHVLNVRPGAVNTGLYNISSGLTRLGKAVGFIVEPDVLARKAIRALLHTKRYRLTVPCVWGSLLAGAVHILPVSVVRLLRKWNIF